MNWEDWKERALVHLKAGVWDFELAEPPDSESVDLRRMEMTEEIRLEEPRLPATAILSKFDADAAIIIIVYLSLSRA